MFLSVINILAVHANDPYSIVSINDTSNKTIPTAQPQPETITEPTDKIIDHSGGPCEGCGDCGECSCDLGGCSIL